MYPELWMVMLAEKHIDDFAGDRKWVNIGEIIYRDSCVNISCTCSSQPIVTLFPFFTTNYGIPHAIWIGICSKCDTIYYGL